MNRVPWPIAMLGCLLDDRGCAKRVPSPDMKFEAQQKVVLSSRAERKSRDGWTRANGSSSASPVPSGRARVGEVTDEKIVLTDRVRLRDTNGVAAAGGSRRRTRVSRSAEPLPEKTFLRSEIVGVETLLKTDSGKTARNTTFWTFSAAVLTLLLGRAVMNRRNSVAVASLAMLILLCLVPAVRRTGGGRTSTSASIGINTLGQLDRRGYSVPST